MSVGVSVFLILAGAILRFAVTWSPQHVDLQVIGVIGDHRRRRGTRP